MSALRIPVYLADHEDGCRAAWHMPSDGRTYTAHAPMRRMAVAVL